MRARELALLLGVTLIPPARAADAPDFDHVRGATLPYSFSFYLDACGESVAGELVRRMIADKVAQCPFMDDAKAEFRKATGVTTAQAYDWIAKYHAELGSRPETVPIPGNDPSCRGVIDFYAPIIRRSRAYALGEASLEEATADLGCDALSEPIGP